MTLSIYNLLHAWHISFEFPLLQLKTLEGSLSLHVLAIKVLSPSQFSVTEPRFEIMLELQSKIRWFRSGCGIILEKADVVLLEQTFQSKVYH